MKQLFRMSWKWGQLGRVFMGWEYNNNDVYKLINTFRSSYYQYKRFIEFHNFLF